MNDPQSVFLLLLMCGSTRANFWLRALRPEDTESFARRHDEHVWTCLRQILGTPNAPVGAHTLATLALSAGGLGLGSAVCGMLHIGRVGLIPFAWSERVTQVLRNS